MEGWHRTPDVLLLQIYQYLPFKDTLSASSTCKNWREILFHPLNWDDVTFYYLDEDINREIFLRNKTSHFISSCQISIPIDHQLLSLESCKKQEACIDSEVESILYSLCYNTNISKLSIVQSPKHSYPPNNNCAVQKYGGFKSCSRLQEVPRVLVADYNGIITRSRSIKMRQMLKIEDPHRQTDIVVRLPPTGYLPHSNDEGELDAFVENNVFATRRYSISRKRKRNVDNSRMQ